MSSYHDAIQAVAKAIEAERAKTYVVGSGTGANVAVNGAMTRRPTFTQTEAEKLYLMGAEYKIIRARGFTQSREKALDDIVDAYNYLAMAFNEMTKNAEADKAVQAELAALREEVVKLRALVAEKEHAVI